MSDDVRAAAECELLCTGGHYEQAVACFTRNIDNTEHSEKDNASLALLYNNRGHAKYMMVDFYAARDDYDAAIRLDPGLAAARYNRATIYYRMGEFAPALEDFIAATKLEPENPEYQAGLQSCQQCLSGAAAGK